MQGSLAIRQREGNYTILAWKWLLNFYTCKLFREENFRKSVFKIKDHLFGVFAPVGVVNLESFNNLKCKNGSQGNNFKALVDLI